jgi:hypothetical protein
MATNAAAWDHIRLQSALGIAGFRQMLFKAVAIETDGLFDRQADNMAAAGDVENRPIDADSG